MNRCKWCNLKNELYVKYHDEQWGVPCFDDGELFELLVLELFQSGLSWEIILNKRSNFRRAFDGFNYKVIAEYSDADIERLMNDESIVRNRNKIEATVKNAVAFIEIQREFSGFYNYIWSFTEGKTIFENDKTSSTLSDAVAKDLKKRGMSFIGTTVAYSYLQSIGVINSHENDCFLYNGR